MRAILTALGSLVFTWAATAAESRVALVIGNSNYQYAGALPNPRNDATDIAAALRQLEFKVIEGTDLSRAGMEKSLRQFGDAAFQADVALLFYAGHGIEINGSNYLLPVDAKLSTENDAAFEAIPMDLALRMTEPAKRLRIVILDACRNNPLAAQMKRLDNKRSLGGGGFAPIEPVADTLVRATPGGEWLQGVPRDHLWAVQTPQAFRRLELLAAHEQARADGHAATDDAGLLARQGHPVRLVPGDARLFKVTTPADLPLAQAVARVWDADDHA